MEPHRIVNPVRLKTWGELEYLAKNLPGWVFRGHRSEAWRLTSKLERARAGGTLVGLYAAEDESLNSFRARPSMPVPQPMPEDDDVLSWFALMQHYGEATRLVDFTESIAIAAYFAVVHEARTAEDGNAAIWAVNTGVLRKMLEGQLHLPNNERVTFDSDWAGGGLFNLFYRRKARVDGLGALAAHAACTNVRMLQQRGLFVFALNLERSLEENLYAVYSLTAAEAHKHVNVGFWNGIAAPHIIPKLQRSPVIKIILPTDSHSEIRDTLMKAGVNRGTLFPDSGS